jgi:hypothetical protein
VRLLLVSSALVTMCLGALGAPATPRAIAIAKAQGEFRVDQATVAGNSSVFEGSVVETGVVRSEVLLGRGGSVLLTAVSRGRVFSDRLVLEQGQAEMNNTAAYSVETHSLKVTPETAGSRVQVGLTTANNVRVAAAGGTANVRNGQGILIARVMPGAALEFQTAGAPSEFKISGVLTVSGGKYFVVDETTHVKVEVQGDNLQRMVGKHVAITGTVLSGQAPAGGATVVIRVGSISAVAALAGAGAGVGAGAGGVAGGAAGGAAAAGVASGGIGLGTVAIIGGVAVASTVGGLYSAGVIGSSEQPASR